MVYKSRFYPHYKALLRKQIAAKGQKDNNNNKSKKDNNNNNPLFLTNPRYTRFLMDSLYFK